MKNRRISLIVECLVLFLLLYSGVAISQVTRGMGVAPEELPDKLKKIKIEDRFLPLDEKPSGVIHALIGHVVVVHSDRRGAYFAKAGDKVYLSDTIYTLKDGKCRVRFENEDIVSIGPDGVLKVDDIEELPKRREKRSFFSLLKGKAMFYAMRLFKYRNTNYRVKTPTAVVGVRGTKFGIHVFKKGEERASIGVMLADSSGGPIHLAQTGGWITNAVCYVGSIDVNGVPVDEGEMFNGKTGQVQPAPPTIMKNLEKDTQVGGEEKGEKKEEEAKEAPAETGEENVQEENAEQNEEQTQIVHEQTGAQVEQEHQQEQVTGRPSVHKGYFTGLLKEDYSGSYSLHNVYVSSSRQDFDSNTVYADSIINPGSDYAKGSGSPSVYENPIANEVVTNSNSSGEGNRPIALQEIGHNQYMEWGYWTYTDPIIIGENSYYFDNKGYYIFGDPTTSDVVSGMHGSFAYSGDAGGTYYTGSGGVDMSGSFSCNVNFDSGSINNFTLSVSGSGTYSASITNASGSFSGSEFSITGGTWDLNGGRPAKKSAYGSFYGPNAQYIGGAWGMYYDSYNGAAGIFKGSR